VSCFVFVGARLKTAGWRLEKLTTDELRRRVGPMLSVLTDASRAGPLGLDSQFRSASGGA
jgi:hypothetical protein